MGAAQPINNDSQVSSVGQLSLVGSKSLFSDPDVGLIDQLLVECKQKKADIKRVATMMSEASVQGTLGYFSRAQNHENDFYRAITPAYEADKALKVLYADYWKKALDLTDVLEFMPQARREEWMELIADLKTPEFDDNVVKSTLKSLLSQRKQFFGEMVDGIFFGLSKVHVTNRPEGFSKRMILAEVLTPGAVISDTGELVHDLRYVISKLKQRGNPARNGSSRILNMAHDRPGEWLVVDGGAFKIKVFKKRTAHLEVHPDLAWQLNQILAINNPMAIPSDFRTPPKKTPKEFPLHHNLISHEALYVLREGRFHQGEHRVFKDKHFYFGADLQRQASKAAISEASKVLEMLGGVDSGRHGYEFDYDIRDTLALIEASGTVPEIKSHQYYPTAEALSERAVALAEIGESHRCLEPEAGTAGLARFMPKDRTQCVEISKMFCKSLAAQGYQVTNADFLKWNDGAVYDRIVMNPPFSEGRALAHLRHAADCLAAEGRLVAILPASLKDKELVPAMTHTWHGPYSDQFTGTKVSVAILVLDN